MSDKCSWINSLLSSDNVTFAILLYNDLYVLSLLHVCLEDIILNSFLIWMNQSQGKPFDLDKSITG